MRHELLAPAGSPEILRAVIAAGADAVYLGGDRFGARAYAPNFTREDILGALDYAHLRGRRIFLTVNTLLKNRELGRELYDYLKPFYENGLDAIIVQDYGVFCFVKKYFPGLALHASTQMSVANASGAAFLKAQGCSRVVTARELSLEEIRDIHEQTGIEIESFIHGALCYCYSGQCLMSSMLGGRSGNRGRCAQPCRLAYGVEDETGRSYRKNERYPLSPKDLCTVRLLPKLCEAGVYSFKIEGRMKQLDYAAGVTSVYRKYLDLYEENPSGYQVEEKDLAFLRDLGSRSGFTEGYYEVRNGREMMSLRDSSHSSAPGTMYVPEEPAGIPISGHAFFQKGRPARLELFCPYDSLNESAPAPGKDASVQKEILAAADGYQVRAEGLSVQEARQRPLTEAEVRERLEQTGGTPFSFSDLAVTIDAGIFLPVKAVKELRRDALQELEQKMLSEFRRPAVPEDFREQFLERKNAAGADSVKNLCQSSLGREAEGNAPFFHVSITAERQLSEVLRYPFVDMVSLDMPLGETALRCAERIRRTGKKTGFFLPHVLRRDAADQIRRAAFGVPGLPALFDTVFVRNFDEIGFARDTLGFSPAQMTADHSLYVCSDTARQAFAGAGCVRYTVSLELNRNELRHMENSRGEFLLYGYVPLMVSAQCVYKNYDACRKGSGSDSLDLFLRDRYFKKFFIKKDCENCYNVIYNSQPLYLLHRREEVEPFGFGSYRISFVREDADRIREVLTSCQKVFSDKNGAAGAPDWPEGFTNGHFRRGVE